MLRLDVLEVNTDLSGALRGIETGPMFSEAVLFAYNSQILWNQV